MKKNQMCTAAARIRGGPTAPGLRGTARFCQTRDGVQVSLAVRGLPESETGFFAVHIHEGPDCGGPGFDGTGGHYNPGGEAHPRHAGDLPPLLGCHGQGRMCVLTDRFCLRDIIGRTLVIHRGPDDLHTQPAGNAGEKLACGEIESIK